MKRIILLTGIFTLFSISIFAQTSEYKFQSIFVYNFTKYIQWPASQQSGDFVIGILGSAAAMEEFQKVVADKTVGSQKIVIKKFASAKDVDNCHMIFIANSNSSSFETIQSKFKGKPTLIISEKSGLGKKGSCINFIQQNNKWKFELNEAATQEAGLKVSKELSTLAIVV